MINLIGLDLIGEAQKVQEQLERDLITNTSNIFDVSPSLNLAKLNPGFKVVSVMRIEFADELTCGYCRAIHGMVMDINDPRFSEYIMPHPNCRGTFFYMTDQMPTQYTTPNWVDPPLNLLPAPKIVKIIEPEPFVEKVIEVKPVKPKAIKPPKFKPAETVEEAREYALKTFTKLNIVDFGKLDIDTVNMMNEVMFKANQLYPSLLNEVHFLGSIEAWQKAIKNDLVERLYRGYIKYGYSEAEAKMWAIRDYKRKVKVSPKTIAIAPEKSKGLEKYAGICISEKYGSSGKVITWKESERESVRLGWKPKGTQNFSSVMWHELGHKAELRIKSSLGGREELQGFILRVKARGKKFTEEGLSRYAATSIAEIVSEAFSEAMEAMAKGEDPRDIAMGVITIINKYCKF